MKIAIVIQKLIASCGGAESWTIQLANWLADRDHDVHCFCTRSSPLNNASQIRIHAIDRRCNRFTAAEELSRAVSSQDFDIVHDMGFGTSFDIFQSHFGSMIAIEQAKRQFDSPVRRFTNQFLQRLSHRKRSLWKQSARQFTHPDAWYIAVSDMVAMGMTKFERVPVERVFTIRNGVDVDRFHPRALLSRRSMIRKLHSIEPDACVLASMAHNHRLKGIPQLVEWLRRHADFPAKLRVVIAGGHKQVPRQVAIGKHAVIYLGLVDDPLDLYSMADIYVHPTLYDACSLTVLEAMACGLPTITTLNNGAAECILHGKNGHLIQSAFDEEGILNALSSLLSKDYRAAVGQAARATAERWTLDDNFMAIEDLYQAKLESKANCGYTTYSTFRLAS